MKYNLKDIMPAEMQCALGACSAIYKVGRVTPKDMDCMVGACNEIYQNADSYFIIGEKVEAEEAGLVGKIGKNEALIKVPKGLIDNRKK